MHAAAQGEKHRRTTTPRLLLLLGPAVAIISVLFGGGLLLGLLQALGYRPQDGLVSLSFEYFAAVGADPYFFKSLALTFYISATSTAIAALLSVATALFMHFKAAQNRLLHFILQIPLTVPHLVVAISMFMLLTPSGLFSRLLCRAGIISSPAAFPLLVNDPFGISILTVYIWKEVPFITFMVLTVLKSMETELLEAGASLGATPMQRFRHIILPTIAPSLGSGCFIVFAFTFGAFEVPYLLGRTFPLTMPVWSYKNFSDIDLAARPAGIAIGIIIAATVIISLFFSQLLLNYSRNREARS